MIESAVNLVGGAGPLLDVSANYARTLYENTFAGLGMQEVAKTAKEDVKNSDAVGKVVLGANGIFLGFEQFGGNEWAIAKAGAFALNLLHEGPIVETIAAGAAGSIASLAIQSSLTVITAATVGNFPQTTQKFQDWFGKDYEHKPSNAKRFATAMTFGSAATIIGESLKNPDLTFKDRLKIGFKSTGMIASGVFFIGAGIGTLSKGLEAVGRKNWGKTLVDVASSPILWVSAFGGLNYQDWKKTHKQKSETSDKVIGGEELAS